MTELKPYSMHKDSGVEWIGEMPDNWEVKPLFTLLEEVKNKNKNNYEINILSLSYGKIIRRNVSNNFGLLPESFETYHIVNNDSIVLRLTDLQNDKRSLRVGYVGERGIITSAYVSLKNKDETMSGKFQYYFLHCLDIMKVFYGLGDGVRQTMSFKDLKRLSIVVPPKKQMINIYVYLDKQTSQIDSLISDKERLIELLEEKRQAVITETVTNGLDPNVKMKESGIEWIGEIPEHWYSPKFKYVGKLINGYAFPSTEFKDKGVRVIKIANIQSMNISWEDESFINESYYEKLPQFRVLKNDLVIALTRPIISTGIKAAIVKDDMPILLNQRNALFRGGNMILISWLYYIFVSHQFTQEFESLIDRTGQQPNISSRDIENIRIPIPSIEEQQEIIDYLHCKCITIDNLIRKNSKIITKLKEYRESLIYEAVTGKIDVWDYVTEMEEVH